MQPQVFTCFLKAVFQTNDRLHIVLRENAKISELFHERSLGFQHAHPDVGSTISREVKRQHKNGIKLLLVLKKQKKRLWSHGLTKKNRTT